MFASELLRAAATELNDLEPGAEYVRFPQDELIGYLNEALAQLAIAKPTLFRTLTTLTLGAGAQQLLPDSIESVEDIIFNVNPDGSLGAPVLPGAFNLERTYGKGVCITEPYSVRSFASLPSSDQFFFVDPPVPPGTTVRVQALVTLAPQVVTTPETPIDLPNASPLTYRNHLKDWMLYRAFSKDTESQTSATNAQQHFKSFYQAVGGPPRTKKAVPLPEAEKQDAPTIE
jgi:hypothetical protein